MRDGIGHMGRHPPGQTPPWVRHPLGQTPGQTPPPPRSDIPSGQTLPSQTTPGQTPLSSQCAAGTHPTGMHSCLEFKLFNVHLVIGYITPN